jgi:hypothetical protein
MNKTVTAASSAVARRRAAARRRVRNSTDSRSSLDTGAAPSFLALADDPAEGAVG